MLKITLVAGVEQGHEFLAAFAESLEKLSPTEIMLYDIMGARWRECEPVRTRHLLLCMTVRLLPQQY